MKVSVILPVLDEAENLRRLLPQLVGRAEEVWVADGGSTDSTARDAEAAGARVIRSPRGRGAQMNAAAAQATGDLLWFLHADSVVPADWRHQITQALRDPAILGGAFRVRIDAPGLPYRLLDAWGLLRLRFQPGCFYGDQGIFVRREAFERLGGFSDWPALEDLDFSFRLNRLRRTRLLNAKILTSARRWKQEGWWRTVIQHSRAALSYRPLTLGILAKAPIPGQVKTRLCPPLTPEQAANLAGRLLAETVSTARELPRVRVTVVVAPDEGIPHVRELLPRAIPMIPQGDGDFGRRMLRFFESAFQEGSRGAVILGADHPGLPKEYLAQAIGFLRKGRDEVVLGPTEDGGYYLIGMARLHPELFEGIPWSTSEAFRLTCDRAKRLGLPVAVLPSWFDLDRPEDLARFARHTAVG